MKKRILIFITILFIGLFRISAQGIKFSHITLNEAIKKAKEENKLVFVDFFTSWCAPCKAMEKGVFPLPEVGNVYNEEYISIKLDAEKEGLEDARKFQVKSYPTYLYLNNNGNVVYKETGSRPTEDFIKLGRDAAASVSSKYSLENLKTDFPNKQDDANFLKIYIDKMIEYGQDPSEGVNAWLKVQKEIDEDDVDMMEFLLKYQKYILMNSKGEEILLANFDEYMNIATRTEEKELGSFQLRIVQNTKDLAYSTKNAELWLAFMKRFKTLPENIQERGNYQEYQMIYYSMIEDYKAYKETVVTYVDSLMADNSVAENKSEKTVKDLYQKGEAYLKYADSKNDYKTLEKWLDYGYHLETSTYLMDNLMANMFYKKGKTKKAIEFKEKALASWPQDDKKLSAKKYELEQMKKGASI